MSRKQGDSSLDCASPSRAIKEGEILLCVGSIHNNQSNNAPELDCKSDMERDLLDSKEVITISEDSSGQEQSPDRTGQHNASTRAHQSLIFLSTSTDTLVGGGLLAGWKLSPEQSGPKVSTSPRTKESKEPCAGDGDGLDREDWSVVVQQSERSHKKPSSFQP